MELRQLPRDCVDFKTGPTQDAATAAIQPSALLKVAGAMTRRASTTTWNVVRKVETAIVVQARGLACACRGLSYLVSVCVAGLCPNMQPPSSGDLWGMSGGRVPENSLVTLKNVCVEHWELCAGVAVAGLAQLA